MRFGVTISSLISLLLFSVAVCRFILDPIGEIETCGLRTRSMVIHDNTLVILNDSTVSANRYSGDGTSEELWTIQVDGAWQVNCCGDYLILICGDFSNEVIVLDAYDGTIISTYTSEDRSFFKVVVLDDYVHVLDWFYDQWVVFRLVGEGQLELVGEYSMSFSNSGPNIASAALGLICIGSYQEMSLYNVSNIDSVYEVDTSQLFAYQLYSICEHDGYLFAIGNTNSNPWVRLSQFDQIDNEFAEVDYVQAYVNRERGTLSDSGSYLVHPGPLGLYVYGLAESGLELLEVVETDEFDFMVLSGEHVAIENCAENWTRLYKIVESIHLDIRMFGSNVELSWDRMMHDQFYRVWKRQQGTSEWQLIAETSDTSFVERQSSIVGFYRVTSEQSQ